VYFVGGEILLYLIYKLIRYDIYWWVRVEGFLAIMIGLFLRIFVKIIVDFSGCVHFRHPFEMGGTGFSLSMIWAQVSSS